MELKPADDYNHLLQQIGKTLDSGRAQAVRSVHAANLDTYWRIGQHIVEFEQGGQGQGGIRHRTYPKSI